MLPMGIEQGDRHRLRPVLRHHVDQLASCRMCGGNLRDVERIHPDRYAVLAMTLQPGSA